MYICSFPLRLCLGSGTRVITLASRIAKGVDHCDIPRVDGKLFSAATFKQKYRKKGKPVVLTNLLEGWQPLMKRWTADYVFKHFGNESVGSQHVHSGVFFSGRGRGSVGLMYSIV